MNDQVLVHPQDDAATQTASEWLSSFAQALHSGDTDAVTALFQDECYWRDLVAFTWNIATMEGKAQIADMLQYSETSTAATNWRLDGPADPANGIISAWFFFETPIARGRGNFRLRDGKCWTFFTSLLELKGFEEPAGRRRPPGTAHQPSRDLIHWSDLRKQEQEELGYTKQPYCVIVGGGQSALILAARLRRLNVPTLIIERGSAPGDTWRSRYKSLYLHDPIWLNHLPYLPFPDHWPVFIPGQKMGNWLDSYAEQMELNYWHSTECQSATFDEETQRWTVQVVREGKAVTLHPQQLVMATGLFGTPRVPALPGSDKFKGQQYHSSQRFDIEACAGKKCIVVGTNSSAHDMAVALWENKADVTMIQRSSAIVVRSSTLVENAITPLFSEDALERGITVERADEIAASVPHKVLVQFQIELYKRIKEIDTDFYEGLRRAGFEFDFGPDESGLTAAAFRGRGFYIDVGGSGLISRGEVKLAHGQIDHLTESALVLTDGTELPADVIVYATGYEPINTSFAKILGQDVADKIGRCWGLGSGLDGDTGPWEGELHNMWKPLAYPNLWVMAGNFAWGRYYSRLLALQIKARMEGVNGPVYFHESMSGRVNAARKIDA